MISIDPIATTVSTNGMHIVPWGKAIAPTDPDLPPEFKEALEISRKMATMKEDPANHSDPYCAVFKNRKGEIVAGVYGNGGLMVRDNGLDISEIQQKIKSMNGPALAKELVTWLAKKLGPDVKIEYPGATPTTKAASSTQSRTNLQRQMDLLAVNQKA